MRARGNGGWQINSRFDADSHISHGLCISWDLIIFKLIICDFISVARNTPRSNNVRVFSGCVYIIIM